MSMSSHQSARAKSTTWLTPPEWIKALGPFDLDPCCPAKMPWQTATAMLTPHHDGLRHPWVGRVWLNPPFTTKTVGVWLEKLADHGDGIALVAARTETQWFYWSVWYRADAICFVKSRPHFHHPNGKRAKGNSGAPIALAAYGQKNVDALERAGLGVVVRMNKHG